MDDVFDLYSVHTQLRRGCSGGILFHNGHNRFASVDCLQLILNDVCILSMSKWASATSGGDGSYRQLCPPRRYMMLLYRCSHIHAERYYSLSLSTYLASCLFALSQQRSECTPLWAVAAPNHPAEAKRWQSAMTCRNHVRRFHSWPGTVLERMLTVSWIAVTLPWAGTPKGMRLTCIKIESRRSLMTALTSESSVSELTLTRETK